MANRIKDLNDGGSAQNSDLIGIDRASPDETFKITVDEVAKLGANYVSSSEFAQNVNRQLANLTAIADIDNRALPNTGKFYDLFDNTNDYSIGKRDLSFSTTTSPYSLGASTINVNDASGFSVGQEITIQDSSNYERLIIGSISTNDITFTSSLLNNYATSALVYRSISEDSPDKNLIFGGLDTYRVDLLNYLSESYNTTITGRGWFRFSKDGLNLYMSSGARDVHYFPLTSAFDFTTIGSFSNIDFSAQVTSMGDIRFNNDETKFYINEEMSDKVYEYNLSTPGDVTTKTYVRTLTVTETTKIISFDFNADGSKLLLLDGNKDKVYEYSLSTNFNLGSVTYTGNNKSFSSPSTVDSLNYIDNDSKIVYTGNALSVYVYTLDNKGDITSGTNNNYSVSEGSSYIRDLQFINEGKQFITFSADGYLYKYESFLGFELLVNDNRYNITTPEDITQFATWIIKNKLAGFSIDIKISVVDSSSNENFVSFDSVVTEDIDSNLEEIQGFYESTNPEDKITLRLTLTRNSTTDDVYLNKLLGAID